MRKSLTTAVPAPESLQYAYLVNEVGIAWVAGLAIWTIAMMAMIVLG
jgi:hypothetical protein